MSREDQALTFQYDHNGLRVQKVVEHSWYPETTAYTYHGKLLTHMTVDYTGWDEVAQQDKLHFFYDSVSRLAKASYNGIIYTYIHNLQGDIIGLLDSAGTLVVEYKYDVWGKLLNTTGMLADTLGKRNPFRYRGYVYDEETGLYYIWNRYYNSAWRRFLNSDKNYGKREGIVSFNLFAYCANTPINNFDIDGCDFVSWISDKWSDLCFEVPNLFSALEAEGGVGGGIGASRKITGVLDASAFASVDVVRLTADDNILSLDQAIVLDEGITVFDDYGVSASYRKPRDLSNPYEDISAKFNYILGYGKTGIVSLNKSEWQNRRRTYYSKKKLKEQFAQRPRKIIVGMGRTRRVAILK